MSRIEQQQFEDRPLNMKKNRNDKNISKSESRFKSKFEFLKKLPHSVLSNSAVEKARAFFRSSELKHHDSSNSNEQSSPSSSSNQQHTTVNTLCSSFNSTDINENTENNNSSLDLVTPKIYFSTSNMIKVDKINSKDMMNHQIIHNDQNDYKLSSKQCQNKYKQYSKPSLLIPKQYYNDILNKRYQYYFTPVNKYDSCPRSYASTLTRHSTYSTRLHSPYNYLTPCNEASSNDQLPISLYNYRSYARREIKSSLDEPYIRPSSSIIQPLPSSSSMLTWNQCVRRLNTEYKLTIIALQQAKERLEQIYLNPKKSISKYANLVARDIKNLSNNERKRPTNVTFCLPSSSSSSSSITTNFSSSSISIRQIEKNKNFPSTFLSKPKFIKPVELNTFSSSSSKLEPVLAIVESNEKLDTIDTIIRKFNDLNGSLSVTKVGSSTIIPNNHTLSTKINDSTTNLDVYIKSSIINNDLKEISDQSLLPSSSKSILINEKHQLENSLHEEETTYTIKTFYQSTNTNENNSSSNHQHVVIVEENTTKEKFNLACEKQHQEIEINCTSPQNIVTIDEPKLPSSSINSPQNSSLNENFPAIETSSNYLINNTSSSSDTSSTLSNSHNKTRTSFIPLKNNNNNKPILQTSKRPTTTTKANISHLGQSSKITVSSTRLKSPSSKFINSTNTSMIRKPTKNTTNKIQSQSSSITKQQSSINSSQINESQNKTNSTSSIDKNRVKSIVNQINANTSSHSIVSSSKTNKRTHYSVSNQSTTSTSKNTLQRK
ncbi:unnamed protein product [Rotaria sordida]|uniref:Uncharacterized protein n=1 Tax=Rotaria sordida TaxID=392033 RepID=A0A814BEB5_9BILA|nr:unnamed protein product [Rotaria sordida]